MWRTGKGLDVHDAGLETDCACKILPWLFLSFGISYLSLVGVLQVSRDTFFLPSIAVILYTNKVGTGCMKKAALSIAPILAVITLLAIPAANATGASQIVLSCTVPDPHSQSPNGCRSSEGATTPPIIVAGTAYFIGGFWIWCQNPNGGTPYGPDCSGAVYIFELNLATQAGVYETTSISGHATACGPTGLQVTFASSDSDTSCTLNVPASPSSGGTNSLSGFCDRVPITFSNSVVQVS